MKSFKNILLFGALVLLNGCLNDPDVPVITYDLDPTAKILSYIESTGDFANSPEAPALISTNDVYSNLDLYFILDIRPTDEFLIGHIQNAINVNTQRLYEVVDSLNSLNPDRKIILVSKNGQASSFFVSLLRLAGFSNTYSMNFGMAYWHLDFADEWLNSLKMDEALTTYEDLDYPKLPMSSLPNLSLPSDLKSDKELALYRIREVIKNGFKSNINYSINFDDQVKNTHLKVCYGYLNLYRTLPFQGGAGHPAGTIWYQDNPTFEFRSTVSLQTLPADRPIIIYSANGQSGACITAYLTVLGYNVKTLLFGTNQLFYWLMSPGLQLVADQFNPQEIANYPYIKGN